MSGPAKRVKDPALHKQQCVAALQVLNGGTIAEVAQMIGKHPATVKKWMNDLHKTHLIYVHKFVRAGGCPKPVRSFRVGNRPDMVKEMTDGRAKDEREDVERAWRKHEAWKKTWTPHCDIAAAWMMGGIAA